MPRPDGTPDWVWPGIVCQVRVEHQAEVSQRFGIGQEVTIHAIVEGDNVQVLNPGAFVPITLPVPTLIECFTPTQLAEFEEYIVVTLGTHCLVMQYLSNDGLNLIARIPGCDSNFAVPQSSIRTITRLGRPQSIVVPYRTLHQWDVLQRAGYFYVVLARVVDSSEPSASGLVLVTNDPNPTQIQAAYLWARRANEPWDFTQTPFLTKPPQGFVSVRLPTLEPPTPQKTAWERLLEDD